MTDASSGAIKVLLTGGGGSGTIEVMKSLKQKGGYTLIAADASRYSAGFVFADRHSVIPFGVSPDFTPAIRALIDRERPDFVIPLVDEEIDVVHELVQREFPEVRVVAPTRQFSALVLDKWRMYQELSRLALPVPKTWLASEAAEAEFPAVVKPRSGRGSRGVAYPESQGDLADYLENAANGPDQYIVQERLIGAEYTVSAVVALGGPLLAVVPKEVVVKRGITQVGVTRRNAAIEKLVTEIQVQMRADGPFNVQLVLCEDGVPRVFEINPRYSTTVALTLASGLDEVDAVLRHALGRDPGSLTFEPDLMMIRYPAQIYVKEQEWNPPAALPSRKPE